LGLRHSTIGYGPSDIGKIMENAVYLHLKVHQWNVTVGSSEGKEVDFVAEKNGEKLYGQVTYMTENDRTVAREFGNLLAIPDNFSKILVTMDNLPAGSSYKGIEQTQLMNFLNREL
jgi:predicted AAA+ superfamily ATPase